MLAWEILSQRTGNVDFSNPAAVQWVRDDVLRCLVFGLAEHCDPASPFKAHFPPPGNTPVAGFMADFGEHLPLQDIAVHSGEGRATRGNTCMHTHIQRIYYEWCISVKGHLLHSIAFKPDFLSSSCSLCVQMVSRTTTRRPSCTRR